MASARAQAKAARGRGEPALQILRELSARMDALLQALFAAVPGAAESRICLLALGGYGRQELFPYSDLDLLLLAEPEDDGPLVSQLVEGVTYPLWDAKLSVGYAVRGLEETLGLAPEDLTVCTALLDARPVAGDPGRHHALYAAALRELFGPGGERFLATLIEERAARHQRFGRTVFLLEPNVKLGKGGLRDMNTGLWAAKACLGVAGLEELAAAGGGSPRQATALIEAQRFLLDLRLALHLQAGRHQDHLLFELQEMLGPQLFPETQIPGLRRRSSAVAPAVERLMHAFYRHARTVVLETEGVLERCRQRGQTLARDWPAGEAGADHLRLGDGLLRSSDPDRFWDEPAELLRAFVVSLEQGVPLGRHTRDAIGEAAAGQPGAQLVADARAAELFLQLLVAAERPGGGTILEELHHAGLLTALIPEFEACTGRIQHDLYHVYTVDLHSLYVVSLLKAWLRGEQAEENPTAVGVMVNVEGLRTLFLSALLHDVGKPLGRRHAAKGGRLAAGVAARLGLAAAEVETVRLLVEQHLTMAHLSQRRDIADPKVIETLLERVGTLDRLRQLYLLTLADTAMTAPGNLTEWKSSLLEELYIRAYVQLVRGDHASSLERGRELWQKQSLLEHLMQQETPGAASLVARMPQELLLAHAVEDLAYQLTVAWGFEAAGAELLRVSQRPLAPSQARFSAAGGGRPPEGQRGRPAARREPGDEAQRSEAQRGEAQRGEGTPSGDLVPDDQLAGALKPETVEVTICCWDSPGRLAAITGVMLAHNIEVLAAEAYTLDPPAESSRPATVLDIFIVRPPASDPEAVTDPWTAFRRDLTRALAGELSVRELVRRHTRPSGLPQRILPRVELEVAVDNQISGRSTVIDVQAPDRPGTLFAITRTLSEQGLEIHLSKVATEAGRVVDIFYVSDQQTGGKVLDEGRLQEIRRAIVEAIAQLER